MTLALSAFLLLLLAGMPVVFVLGIAATLTLLILQPHIPITIVAQRMYDGLDSFTIMAIPFFVFAGAVMDAGGISRRIVDFATALVGWIVGSLLMVSVVAATGLAAISGSGSADVAAISAIMQPELRRRRYDIDFSAAVIACAGSLAQIIPPSLMMVVVALVSNLSVGAMFPRRDPPRPADRARAPPRRLRARPPGRAAVPRDPAPSTSPVWEGPSGPPCPPWACR